MARFPLRVGQGAGADLFERRFGFWRGLCPSCEARRAAEFASSLKDGVVADVGHAQWVFTVPKLLRPCYMHH